MIKKVMIVLAVILLAICLTSGGCMLPPNGGDNVQTWKDLIKQQTQKFSLQKNTPDKSDDQEKSAVPTSKTTSQQKLEVKLYFADVNGKSLVLERRDIVKTEGIARRTLEELIKGPGDTSACKPVAPAGTSLRDINIKPDGSCIVDLNSEARNLDSAAQEKMLVYAIVDTLGQFPTVKKVSFMVDGQTVDTLAGYTDISLPLAPDYEIKF